MFDKHITDFNENILGLRDFVELIDPFLTEKFKEHDKHIAPLIMSGMLNDLLSGSEKLEEEQKKNAEDLKAKVDADIVEIYKRPIDVQVEKENGGDSIEKDGKNIVFKIQVKKSDNLDIVNHIDNAKRLRGNIELLYKNSLISLMSSVEWFFSQILHFYYDRFPESAGIQKRTMTLSDLKAFGTILDAEKYMIDLKIEEVLRGNFDSWITLLKTELSLKLGYIDSCKEELIEFYQRRNLFVHNGGVVNSIYLSKVNENFRKSIGLNDKLDVDKEYLDNAICKLQKSFILIAAELWKSLDKSDKRRGEVLIDITYENLLKSRWEICEGLSYFVLHDSLLEPVDKVIAQLNYWLCKKRTGQYESIKKEVQEADFSDKKEIFQLGLYALRDDITSFIKILPIALDSNQLNIERLEEFPIFEEARNTEAYIKFKEESKYFKEPNKPIDKEQYN